MLLLLALCWVVVEERTVGKFLDSLNDRTECTDKANYHREQYQSFMSGPEWRNVEMAEET